MSQPKVVVLGNVSLDEFCRLGQEILGRRVVLGRGADRIVLDTTTPIFPGAKVTVAEPLSSSTLRSPRLTEGLGGGGLGTASSLATWLPSKVLYVDVSVGEARFRQYFESRGIATRFFGLRSVPVNAVVGHRSNKVILKSPIAPVGIPAGLRTELRELLKEPEWIVLNSVKDEPLARMAVEAALRRRCAKLAAVVTSSLSPSFVARHILPNVDVLIVSFDEMNWLLSHMPATITASKQRLLALCERMRGGARVFVTLGKDGVMCGSRRGLFHVRLRAAVARRVEASVSSHPAAVTGAGDWFAGGVIASRCCNRWRRVPDCPPSVDEAVAGCVSALHHLGQEVAPGDFDVREDISLESVYYARSSAAGGIQRRDAAWGDGDAGELERAPATRRGASA